MSSAEENAFQIAKYVIENPQEDGQVAIRDSLGLLDDDFRVALKYLVDGDYCKTYGRFGSKDAGIRQKNLARLQDFVNKYHVSLDLQDLVKKADDHYYAEEYIQAINLYNKALAIDPTSIRSITQVSKANEVLSRLENIARLPRSAKQLYRVACSFRAAGDNAIAIIYLKKAITVANLAGIRYEDAEKLLAFIEMIIKSPRVFISYSRSDFNTASEIYSFLRSNDCVPWLDKYDLIPGQDWELEIRRQINESDFVVACLSKNSVSKRGYVQKELKYAISILEEFPEGKIYLIPVRVDDCSVPESLMKRQWLDWSAPNAKDRLIRAIKS